MQPDNLGAVLVTKVAEYGVLDHELQIVPVFALRENAVAQCSSVKTAFNGFGHLKDDLFWRSHVLSFAHRACYSVTPSITYL